MTAPLAIIVETDESMGLDEVVVLDGDDRIVWTGYLFEVRLIEILGAGPGKIRMHPASAARQVAFAASLGQPPIQLD